MFRPCSDPIGGLSPFKIEIFEQPSPQLLPPHHILHQNLLPQASSVSSPWSFVINHIVFPHMILLMPWPLKSGSQISSSILQSPTLLSFQIWIPSYLSDISILPTLDCLIFSPPFSFQSPELIVILEGLLCFLSPFFHKVTKMYQIYLLNRC